MSLSFFKQGLWNGFQLRDLPLHIIAVPFGPEMGTHMKELHHRSKRQKDISLSPRCSRKSSYKLNNCRWTSRQKKWAKSSNFWQIAVSNKQGIQYRTQWLLCICVLLWTESVPRFLTLDFGNSDSHFENSSFLHGCTFHSHLPLTLAFRYGQWAVRPIHHASNGNEQDIALALLQTNEREADSSSPAWEN